MPLVKIHAIIIHKESRDTSEYAVVKMKYDANDNVLWITDIRGHLIDFDLDEFEVVIQHI